MSAIAVRTAPVDGVEGVEVRELSALDLVELGDLFDGVGDGASRRVQVEAMAEIVARAALDAANGSPLVVSREEAMRLPFVAIERIATAAMKLNGLMASGDALELDAGN